MELGEVGAQDGWRVSGWIAGDEDAAEGIGFFRLNDVDGCGHLVELVGADVGAMGEAKVDLDCFE